MIHHSQAQKRVRRDLIFLLMSDWSLRISPDHIKGKTIGPRDFSTGLLSFSKDSCHVVGCSIVHVTWSSLLYDPDP